MRPIGRCWSACARSSQPQSKSPLLTTVYTPANVYFMNTLAGEISTRELRSNLADVLGRAMYAGERIGITRNGNLAAVVVSVSDLEALEEFEMQQDIQAYREAKAEDDGERLSLAEVRGQMNL